MKSFQKPNLLTALILGSIVSLAVNAADSTATTGGTSSAASTSGASTGSGPTISVSEGSFTPATMPASTDRAQKSKASAAAAQAGAAFQQINCMRAQADAQMEEDPESKTWKQIAAGLQCQQAQASQQSAQQNEESAKALSSEDIFKPASFTPGSVTITGGITDANIEIPTVNTKSSENSTVEDPDTTIADNSKAATSDKPKATSNAETEKADGVLVPTELPKSTLNPIESGSIVSSDGSKNTNTLGGGTGMNNGLGFAGSTTGSNKLDKANSVSREVASEIADLERGIRAVAGTGGEASGSDGESSKGSGILDALMAQLNPEAAPEGFLGSFAPAEVVSLEKDAKPGAKINIFEYATYRFQTAVTQERIQKTSLKTSAPAVRALASKPVVGAASFPKDLLSASRQK